MQAFVNRQRTRAGAVDVAEVLRSSIRRRRPHDARQADCGHAEHRSKASYLSFAHWRSPSCLRRLREAAIRNLPMPGKCGSLLFLI
jgi:hypothetical protein